MRSYSSGAVCGANGASGAATSEAPQQGAEIARRSRGEVEAVAGGAAEAARDAVLEELTVGVRAPAWMIALATATVGYQASSPK